MRATAENMETAQQSFADLNAGIPRRAGRASRRRPVQAVPPSALTGPPGRFVAVAIPKICGVETEFGIFVRGARGVEPDHGVVDPDQRLRPGAGPLRASRLAPPRGSSWDFEDEMPHNDARGTTPAGAYPPEVETHLVNAVLTNGARYYVDHAHPECSTPEVADAMEVVMWDRAAEEILRRSMDAARSLLGADEEIVVHKNNSDGKGNSYGCHENYLLSRDVPVRPDRPPDHAVLRHPAGVLRRRQDRRRGPGLTSADVPYQLSQRADFFEEEVGLETTLKRPIVNTRDEPHADAQKYRRLHVIIGDANMSEVATYLKVGTTAIVLAMIEDDELGIDLSLATPVPALRAVSYDTTPGAAARARATAAPSPRSSSSGSTSSGPASTPRPAGSSASARRSAPMCSLDGRRCSSGLETDPTSVADIGRLGGQEAAGRRLPRSARPRRGATPGWPRSGSSTTTSRPDKCLAHRAGLQTIADPDAVASAVTNPPGSTRAFFRGRCLQKWPESIVAANWDSLVFDVGGDPLRRVPMMEPSRGTAAHVGTLIDECETAAELLDRLGS